jgi:thioredoxin-dependent peroxiredoxin
MQCRQHVASLRRVYDYLQKRNISVLVIGGGNPQDAARLKATYKLPFPVLADKERAVYARYGLDKVLFMVQRSATFLVDRQGVVRYVRRASSPSAALDQAEFMREVEKLHKSEST